MTIAHGQAYFTLISFSGTISYLIFHQKFHFLLLGFREPRQYYYRISGNRMNSRVLIGRVRTLSHPKMYGTPFIRLSFFFRSSFQFHVGVHFSLVGPLLLPRLHILPRKMLQQESSGGAVRKCFEPFCAYTLQPRTQFQLATAAPLQPSQLLSGVLEFYHLLYLCLHLSVISSSPASTVLLP